MDCACLRCGHLWHSKILEGPTQCPKCKSCDWDREATNSQRAGLRDKHCPKCGAASIVGVKSCSACGHRPRVGRWTSLVREGVLDA